MADVVKKETRTPETLDVFDRLLNLDRLFDDWARMWPLRRPFLFGTEALRDEMIRVDEFKEDEALVIRAELPGIDPDRDVEITASDGMLHITAERRDEHQEDAEGYRRREMRYGSFTRSLPLPPGVREGDIAATYKDGILEIRVPTPKSSATKVPVAKS